MLALLFVPAILGIALIINLTDDDDDNNDDAVNPEDVEPQIVSDGFTGTDAAENLVADTQGGSIDGGGGNDTITGSDMDDDLRGGDGDDIIFAQDGDDTVSGDAGNDRIFLNAGDDVYGPEDTAENTAGDDFVNGGSGNDFIVDLLGSNRLVGSSGNDVLISLDGLSETGQYDTPEELGTTDTLSGGFGNDILVADGGDVVTGGVGNDLFFVTDDEDTDLEEVQIEGFDTRDDALMVIQLDGLTSNSELGLVAAEGGVRVSFEGRAVAFLQGLSAADIPNIAVSLTSLDGLDNALN